MPRLALPLEVADLSAFARSTREQLAQLDHTPGHVEMLNILSRAAGYRNFQHFKASCEATRRLRAPPPAALAPDAVLVEKVARHFGPAGELVRWPSKARQQTLCLWLLWSRLPSGETLTEGEISTLLKRWHSFGDHALLRRSLFELGLVQRSPDGRAYRRVEQRPPPELGLLLACLHARGA